MRNTGSTVRFIGFEEHEGADMTTTDQDWTKPSAMAIPPEGYFKEERGRYGPVYPEDARLPRVLHHREGQGGPRGRGPRVRETIEETIEAQSGGLGAVEVALPALDLFDVGSGLHFQYQGIFDTDFDKYTEDAVQLFSATGITTVFTNLEGFPEDWKENPEAFIKFVREHQVPSFLEYGEYPYVTADEIKKALRLKAAFSEMLDQMQ